MALFLSLLSCSGVSAGAGGGGEGGGSVPATYRVTVTGSAPGTPVSAGHNLTVTLVVEELLVAQSRRIRANDRRLLVRLLC
jgi:hypothetical protein